MAARVFTLALSGATITGASTLVFINPSATTGLELLRAWCSQSGSAVSAQQRVAIVTQVTVFPTLTSQAPVATGDTRDASRFTGATNGAAGTSGVNASAEGAGAKTTLIPDAFNVLSGWSWVFTPEERIIVPAGSATGLGLYLSEAPSSLTKWNAGFTFREL
jgi:hypothetical protein